MALKFAGLPLKKVLIMGIVNVTPDSFSDGGETTDIRLAIDRGFSQAAEGADIIDVGGQSTRPGAIQIEPHEELKRISPVVDALVREGLLVSVDTYQPEVMRAVISQGAKIINDVSGLSADFRTLKVIASSDVSVVLMHNCRARAFKKNFDGQVDMIAEIDNWFEKVLRKFRESGLEKERFCIDPGIGFGKTPQQNIDILENLDVLLKHDCPIMVGVSRKFGLAKPPKERLKESISLALRSVERGCQILRVHDVPETRQALDQMMGLVIN
ncbi:MAG: dihydropteroate synthase [Pseudomonadota bacterium]|nr:dihydropteroate synthase [Pseudomonadota bacterium]